MSRSGHTANNARSDSMNPNNPAYWHSVTNRSVHLNPNSGLHQRIQPLPVSPLPAASKDTPKAPPAVGGEHKGTDGA